MKPDDFLPKRLSVDQLREDPELASLAQALVITLDGEVQDKVVSYDTEKGTLRRYATDAEGLIIVRGGAAVTQDVSGRVEVHLREREKDI